MRMFTRLTLGGILIASCSEGITDPFAPGGSCSSQDTVFSLYPESLRLAMGGAGEVFVEAAVLNCSVVTPVASAEVTWTIRDPSIAAAEDELEGVAGDTQHVRLVVPRAPG